MRVLLLRLIVLLVIIDSALMSWAKPLAKVYDLNFSAPYLKVYTGGKATVRVNSIPGDVDALQVAFAKDAQALGLTILGSRNIALERGQSSVDFNIEIPELSRGAKFKKLKLNIRAFSKAGTGESFRLLSKSEVSLSPKSCLDEKQDLVCGRLTVKCRTNENCSEKEIEKTFSSECELDKQGVYYLHKGACD